MGNPVKIEHQINRLDASLIVANELLSTKHRTFEMAFVEGGCFTMGCTPEQEGDCRVNEKPAHQVTVSSFYIGKFTVTQEEWIAVMGENPSHFRGTNMPVDSVGWNDVQAFLKRLNTLTGGNYRLPTEAEWEFAARGGHLSKGYKYSGSNDLYTVAQCINKESPESIAVGLKEPNELGLYDMSGNVWEWCSDWYGAYLPGSANNPKGPTTGKYHVSRGGSARFDPSCCRVSYRHFCPPECNQVRHGLRLASSVEDKTSTEHQLKLFSID
jgi:formylglycine-generating enzyme required for sulfatase activity